MNIIKNKKILKGLGHQIDQLNTLGGGVGMVNMEVANKKDSMVITVKAPTVSPEAMKVQVEYNKLFVYGTLPQHQESEQQGVSFPMFARVFDIPFYIDAEEISAVYKDNQLKVILPYNTNRLNGRKIIEIERY